MNSRFGACVPFTLREEGGFANNPADPGGATNMGITRATLSRWLRRPALVSDVRALTQDEAAAIYEAYYWHTIAGDSLPIGIDLMVFDHAVLSGPHQSACDLQRALGFFDQDVDGAIGPVTLGAVQGADVYRLLDRLRRQQAAHYQSCSTFSEFGAGWLDRLERRTTAALNMVGS